MNTSLRRLNQESEADARAELLRCCGSQEWAGRVLQSRPFADAAALLNASEAAFDSLSPDDWREAFEHHPRIGDVHALRAKFSTLAATKAWAGGEQAGTRAASEATLQALADGNRAYEDKFGFLFIVCATGKSAEEMLALLQARLPHEAQAELQIAAEQQRQITRLRLQKLLAPAS